MNCLIPCLVFTVTWRFFVCAAYANADQPLLINKVATNDFARRGHELLVSGKFDEAITNLLKAVQLNPKDVVSFYNLGNALHKRGDYSNAITYLNRAVVLNPQNAAAFDIRGLSHYQMSDVDSAIYDFNKALKIDKRNPRIWNNRALAYSKKGDLEKALKDFNKSILLAPENALPIRNRADLHIKCKRWTEAMSDLTEAIRLDPKNANSHNTLAWTLTTCPDVSLRDAKRASTLAMIACELDKWRTWQYVGTLAASCAEQGDFDRAIMYQQEVMAKEWLSEKERQDERRVLGLYQQHLPYREMPVQESLEEKKR